MITSPSNARVKHARSLAAKRQRSAHRQFLVEGVRVIEEAERAGLTPALVFYEPQAINADTRAATLLTRLRAHNSQVEAVTPAIFETLAMTDSPQGIVAVYPIPDLAIPPAPSLVLVLDALRDPGNLGTVLRTAWAAGVDLVLLAPGTADPFNPKVVRAGMGAHFFLPLVPQSWDGIRQTLGGVPRIYLADAGGELEYTQADWSTPRALIVGGEAQGASDSAGALATARLSIPMPGHAESLNAAIATGILLFEAVRNK